MTDNHLTSEHGPPDPSRYRPLREVPALTVDPRSVDVRGWRVVTRAAEPVGTVTDMLVDIDTLRAEFLVVDPDRQTLAALPETESALVPVSTTQVDAGPRQVVVVSGANRAAPDIRLRYRSTTHLAWTAAALGTAAMLVAWLLGLL